MRKIIMWTWPSLYDSNNTFSGDQSFFINTEEWQTSAHPKPELCETMYGVFMMLVYLEGGDDKSSQTNFYCHLPYIFNQKGTLYLIISFRLKEALTLHTPTHQKVLEQAEEWKAKTDKKKKSRGDALKWKTVFVLWRKETVDVHLNKKNKLECIFGVITRIKNILTGTAFHLNTK